MEYRLLGKTGVEVSQLCLGTMPFGGPADEKESAKMFKSCRDIGINFFDCANVYEKGRSEKVLGKLMADSSCLLYTSPSPRDQRGSRMPSSA